MNPETTNILSSNLTIVSSLIAIAAVTICTILSSIVTQIGSRLNDRASTLSQEKISAYYEFLQTCDLLYKTYDAEHVLSMSNAATKAMLFASKKTQTLIADYSTMIMTSLDPEIVNTITSKELATVRINLIFSMQKDLKRVIL